MVKRILTLLFILVGISNINGNDIDTFYMEKVPVVNNNSIANITSINHDLDGNLWITTYDGLYKYDGYHFFKYESNENENHGLIKNFTLRTHLSQDGKLWIAGAYSIYYFDTQSGKIVRASEDARKTYDKLYEISYFDIEDIDDQYMAVGTKTGLFIYNKSNQKIVSKDSLVNQFEFDSYSTNAHVVQIERDPINSHILFLLTRSGIYTFDCYTKKTELLFYDKKLDFKVLRDKGFSMVVNQDAIYLHINWKNIYRYDRTTKRIKEIRKNDGSPHNYIRNIIPYDDGILLVYIGKGIQRYIFSEDIIVPLANMFEDKTVCESLSYVGLDHEGRYSCIQNNKLLLKSKARSHNDTLDRQIWTANMQVDGRQIYDTIKDISTHVLETYQRNVQFDIGLSNRYHNDKESYYYRLNESKKWKQIENNTLTLTDLSAGKHNVYCKIISNGKEYEKRVKTFAVKPYFYETTWFFLLVILGLIGVGSIISHLVNSRKKDKKTYQKKMLELEMNALRSQMNPHFLFNSINSIKSYVISKDKDEAAEYLTQFAKLIRMILENSRKKYLTLEEEIEMLKLYIIMEQKRLNFSFDYDIDIHPDIDQSFMIAPMLLQPYIENAIWHGLMNKYGDKKLTLQFVPINNGIQVNIIDNGVGRIESQKLNAENATSKKSLGLKITEDREEIIKKMYQIDASIQVIDHYQNDEASGTEVQITLPQLNQIHQYD